MFQEIDFDNWKRKDIFEQFTGFQYTFTIHMDMTALYQYIKREKKKFYPVIAWVLTKTANEDEDYRYMLRDGKVGIMDQVGTNFTVVRDADPTLFAHGVTPYYEDLDQYYAEFQKNQKLAEGTDRLYYDAQASGDAVDISVTPNLTFQGLSLNVPPSFYAGKKDGKYTPFTTVGKFYKQDGKVMLPVCTNFHHCVNDGYHAHKYFALLQANLDLFKTYE